MKSKIYSIALTAIMGLAAHGIAVAQTAPPAPPVPAVTPVPASPAVAPVPADPEVGVYRKSEVYVAGAPNTYYYTESQDSTYKDKMRKLQDKIRELSKEMSTLAREQSKKIAVAAQERTAALRKSNALRFDSTFSRINRNFSTNINTDNDANLQKQIASGDVKEKTKTFSKSYPVDGNDKLQIENRYGKITVNTWAKNEVKVDVDIRAYSLEDDQAQKLLDQTTVESSKTSSTVSFTTNIDQGRNSWWGSSTENGKITKMQRVVINYTVYMPAKNALTINNRYGSVSLPNLDGKLNITNAYGGLVAKALTNSDNVISVKYGDADIASLNGSDLSVAYGKLALESADKLNANISYTTVKIGKLNTSGNIDIKYGNGISIGDLGKQLKSLTINSSYTPVKIGSTADVNADFDVTVHYAEFMHNDAVKVTSQTPDKERGFTSTKNYKGQIGKGSSDKVITINAKYGSGVKFD